MFIPVLTEASHKELYEKGMTMFKAVSALNSVNVKGKFSTTPPPRLQSDNFMVIRNHRGRYKYFPVTVEDGLLSNIPAIVWPGYVYANGAWRYITFEQSRFAACQGIQVSELMEVPVERLETAE